MPLRNSYAASHNSILKSEEFRDVTSVAYASTPLGVTMTMQRDNSPAGFASSWAVPVLGIRISLMFSRSSSFNSSFVACARVSFRFRTVSSMSLLSISRSSNGS